MCCHFNKCTKSLLIKSTTVHDLKNSQQSRNKKELPESDKGYKNILLVKERIFMPTIMNKASQSTSTTSVHHCIGTSVKQYKTRQ